jgi:hypothetical protein
MINRTLLGIEIEVLPRGKKVPVWESKPTHRRDTYDVTMTNEATGREHTFLFYDSLENTENNLPVNKENLLSNILSIISYDSYCEDDFEEFCSLFDYNTNSTKDKQLFLTCRYQAQGIQAVAKGTRFLEAIDEYGEYEDGEEEAVNYFLRPFPPPLMGIYPCTVKVSNPCTEILIEPVVEEREVVVETDWREDYARYKNS